MLASPDSCCYHHLILCPNTYSQILVLVHVVFTIYDETIWEILVVVTHTCRTFITEILTLVSKCEMLRNIILFYESAQNESLYESAQSE